MKSNIIDIFENHSHNFNESGFFLLKFYYEQNSILIIIYFTILGGSLKKIAKKITIKVPTNKNTYTNASIGSPIE